MLFYILLLFSILLYFPITTDMFDKYAPISAGLLIRISILKRMRFLNDGQIRIPSVYWNLQCLLNRIFLSYNKYRSSYRQELISQLYYCPRRMIIIALYHIKLRRQDIYYCLYWWKVKGEFFYYIGFEVVLRAPDPVFLDGQARIWVFLEGRIRV